MTTFHSNQVERVPLRRDTRPSVCAVCAKPVAGLMVKDPNLSTKARPKYWGACSKEHAEMIKGDKRPASRAPVSINDDSAAYARKIAGVYVKNQHSSDLTKWSKNQADGFVRAIIQAYLSWEFDNTSDN